MEETTNTFALKLPEVNITTAPLEDQWSDPLGESDNILDESDDSIPVDEGSAANVADTYNMAGIGTLTKPVTVNDVLAEFNRPGSIVELNDVINNIKSENMDVRKQAMIRAISNPNVSVEQRMELASLLRDMNGDFDANMISRQAMHNANLMENSGYTPEEIEDQQKGAEAAEAIPRNVTMETPLPSDEEDMRIYYQQTLTQYYSQADEDAGGSDFVASVLPFRFQVPVMKIFHRLGLDKSVVEGGSGHLLMGEALKMIREHVDSQKPADKMKSLELVMDVLKNSKGIYRDNDIVTMHTLEQVFQKDLFGEQEDVAGNSAKAAIEADIAKLRAGGALPEVIAAKQRELKNIQTDSISGTQLLDNFGSVMDLVGLGSLAKTTLNFGAKWMPKSLTRLRKVAPEMATKTAVDALLDDAVKVKFPDMKPEDVVSSFLPASSQAMQEGGFDGFGELLARQLDIRDRMLRMSQRSNMNAAERADAFKEILGEYGDIAATPGSTLHLNESIIEPVANGVKIEAMFGRSKAKPFSSYAQAAWGSRKEIETVFGSEAKVEIVMRDPATGRLVPVPKGTKPFAKGEFFLKAADERAYESAPTVYHSLMFGEKDVANLSVAPSLWKHLRGPINLLSKETADNIRQVSRQRAEWNKLASNLIADAGRLEPKQQRILGKLIKEGEATNAATGKGKIYTVRELQEAGLDEAGVRAYYGYRNAADIMHEVANTHLRTRMIRDGVKDIHSVDGRVGFAQVRSQSIAMSDIGDRVGMSVFNPATKEFTTLDRMALEKLYKEGGQVGLLEQPMLGRGGKEATHVLIDSKAGTKVLGLPRQVLTKVEGYYPHMWEGNYVVWGLTKAGNRYALGLAKNEKDAAATVERMRKVNATRKAAGKSSRFTDVGFDFDRSLSQDLSKRGKAMEDVYVNMGGPVYGHRNGGTLRNFSKAAGDIQVDPIEAMMRGMEIVGTKVTKHETAAYMRQKLYMYAKENNLLRDPRVIPQSVEDLVVRADKQEAYNKAKAYLDSIDFMLNTHDAVDSFMSKMFLTASSVLKNVSPSLSGKLASKAARGADPMSGIMGLLHRTTIASSPLAQGALQASQSLMMLGIAPVQYAKAVAQTGTIATLIGMRSSALHGKGGFTAAQFLKEAKGIAKLTGMTEDEIVKVVDTILDNGVVSAVGYHTQMRNAVRSAAEERMLANARGLNKPVLGGVGRFARKVDAATFGNLSKYGFEGGESLNQIATFLTLYGRDKAKGLANLADPDYVRKLVGSTAELTGDMIPETGFTYQRGWLKAAMQFVSFQHKMMLLALPQGLGGAKSITAAEKAGMVFAQFLLFGRRAAPHVDAFYRVVDAKIRDQAGDEADHNALYQAWSDPTTKAVIDGLLFDATANYVLKNVTGQDTEYAFSDRFAPGGGSEFMMDRVFALGSNPTQAFFGLAGEKVSKIYSFMKRVGDVTLANVREHDTVPLNERFEELAKEGGALAFSQYNRYLATAAANRMDGWLSAGGNLTEGFGGIVEGNLYTQFGVMTKDRESLYEAMDKYRGDVLHSPEKKQKELDELVGQYYTDLIQSAVKFDSEAPNQEVWGTLMDKWTRERGLLFSVLDEHDAEYINERVAERIQRAIKSPDSAEAIFIERMSKDIKSGVMSDEGPDAALYLENAEFVKNNPRLKEMIHQAYIEATTDDYLERK